MNKWLFTGFLGADPEILSGKGQIVKARLATSSRVKTPEGWVEKTEWHHLVFFNKFAEAAVSALAKGRLVKGALVEGEAEIRHRKSDSGFFTDMVIKEFVVLKVPVGASKPQSPSDQDDASGYEQYLDSAEPEPPAPAPVPVPSQPAQPVHKPSAPARAKATPRPTSEGYFEDTSLIF